MIDLGPEMWQPALLGYLLALVRVAALVTLLPALGETSVPARVKLALSVCYSMVIWPTISGTLATSDRSTGWFALIAIEIGAGLWLGLLLRVFVFTLQVAGSIAAQSTSLSQILGSAGTEPLPAMGHVITMAGLTLALSLGLHIYAAQYLIESYRLVPMGQLPGWALIAESGVSQIARGFQLAFSIAAPFFILSLLYNLTLGVINRAMPQLMVAFVGAPVITAGALMLLVLSIPLMLSRWLETLFDFLATGVIP